MLEKDLLSALGPLGPLYADRSIRDIIVDAPARVLIEGDIGDNEYRLRDSAVQFDSTQALEEMIGRVLKLAGVEREGRSVFDVGLTDGSRMLAIFPPTAPDGPSLIIRKMMIPSMTWEMLHEYHSVTIEMKALLQSAIHAEKNILIAGGRASGKTTFANLVAGLIPPDQRLVVVEQVRQFQIKHPRALFLAASDAADITWDGLLSAASKMRPDWMVIGELIGPEALRAMELMRTGYLALAMMHATGVDDALARLETMSLKANLGLGLGDIRRLIASAFQLICQQEYLPNGRRKVVQIVEMRGLEHDRYVLQPLIRYNRHADKFEATGVRPSWE